MRTTQTLDIRTAIRQANDTFEATFARGDAAGLARLYIADGMLLPPGSDVIQGQSAIAEYWQAVMNMGIKQAKLEIDELEHHGDTAIEIGHYVLSGDGGDAMDRGKYVVTWKQQDGQWKLHRDIWNSSMASPAE